ncbi:unnamed protein product [Auanema sp. JU1783]|nr:unnamed protein product [Auanema sp. JU1783]
MTRLFWIFSILFAIACAKSFGELPQGRGFLFGNDEPQHTVVMQPPPAPIMAAPVMTGPAVMAAPVMAPRPVYSTYPVQTVQTGGFLGK